MLRSKSKWLALIVVLTVPLLYVIDVFIINMAIPAIRKGIGASDSEVQLVIAAYLLGSASFLIIGGRTGDYLGRKKVLFWGMFMFTLTSCFCGLSQTPLQLNIARFFQGTSSAFMVPQSLAFIQVLFKDPKEKAKATGWYGITISFAAIIGQILGGYFAGSSFVIEGWRLIFFINLPVGIAALWAIWRMLDETPQNKRNGFDYSGALILAIGLISLIYSLTKGREAGWPLWSISLILLSGIIFIFFVRDQRRKTLVQRNPLMNTRLFKIREFNIGLLALLFHFMMHTPFLLISAVYLQNGLGIPAFQCGMYFVPHAILFMVSSLIASKLLVRYGKKVLQVGTVIILLTFLLQIQLYKTGVSHFCIILLIAIYGLGNGLVLPSLLNIALRNVPSEFAGVAAGVYSTFQQTASALGISIVGGIFYYVLSRRGHAPDYLKAFDYGMTADILCLLMVGLMLYLLPASPKNKAEDKTETGYQIKKESKEPVSLASKMAG